MTLRAGYRVRQFLAALGLFHVPVTEEALANYLRAAQIELFRRLSAAEQRHALAVLRTLQEAGHRETVLAQAALLHDVGKVGGHIRLWHRVATVLLQAIHPALLYRLALDNPRSWRYPFFVQLYHAQRGAEMAAQAGTHPLVVALIRWHHTPPEESDLDAAGQALLAALRAADETN
ncbi:MAG: HD domain-containing protein [Chloroflexi bacterium]|nr:HD domain-containing protein [Chloroflexota bacterium]